MEPFESPFPSSPRLHFDKNPIVLAALEIRFDVHFGIKDASPAAFRTALAEAYPRYLELGATLRLPSADGTQDHFDDLRPVHQFGSADGRSQIRLSEVYLNLTCHEYNSYEELSKQWDSVLSLFARFYAPPVVRRTSLRYIDTFKRTVLGLEAVPWEELFNKDILGLLASDTIQRAHLRWHQTRAFLSLRSDRNWNVTLNCQTMREDEHDEEQFVIDADFAAEESIAFDRVLPVCAELKIHAGRQFRWAMAEQLRAAMGPHEKRDYDPHDRG